MQPDWTRLAPNRPLDPGDAAYVPRPAEAQRIPDWILTGRSTVLVVGPVGVGKSTELAFAASALQSARIACLVPLDRFENMRRITTDQALLHIAGRLAFVGVQALHLALDASLLDDLARQGVFPDAIAPRTTSQFKSRSAEDLVLLAIREISRLSSQGRITLLIDGLEKTPPDTARLVFDAFERLSREVELVAVVPWHAAYGPAAETVIVPGEKLVVVHPIEVEGPDAAEGIEFFRKLAARRLQLDIETAESVPPEFAQRGGVLDASAIASGGIPRTFLQLLADAASHARVADGESWPRRTHLAMAIDEQRESFRRLLVPGDDDALTRVAGTDGREMPLDQKLRLLSHGLLLERIEGGKAVMRPHPIVKSVLKEFRLA